MNRQSAERSTVWSNRPINLLQRFVDGWSNMSLLGRVLLVGSVTISIVWLSLGAYQSHYISGLRLLGDDVTQTIFGSPREGRGDEWSTYIPMLKQAYLEGFPETSRLEPYLESYRLFVGIPRPDWTMIFTPTLALYFVLPGPLALSFQGLFYNALFLASFVWLLTNLGARKEVAVPVSLMVLFSMYYQVWWSSNLSTLGPSLLPLAVLSANMRWRYKFFLLTWSISHMLMGAMYPAFYYVIAFSLAPLVLLMKRDLLRPTALILAALSAAIAVAIYWSQYADYIEAVSLTAYPGARFSTGGGAPWSVLLGLIFPTAAAVSPVDVGLTVYELCVVGTVLPLIAIAALLRTGSARDSAPLLVLFVTMFVIMAIFTVVGGFPQSLAKYTGLFIVPGRRMQLGLSLLTVGVCALLISRAYGKIENRQMLVAAVIFTIGSLVVGVRADARGQFFMIEAYPWIFLALVVIGIALDVLRSDQRAFAHGTLALPVVLWGAALAHVIIFGSFNPVMRAKDILTPVRTQLTEDWKALFEANGGKPIATLGNYGHLLRGENLPALEAIHLINVEDETYRRTFPEFTRADRETLFNQMRGIRFDNVKQYDAAGITAILPVMEHAYRIEPDFRTLLPSLLDDIEPLNEQMAVDDVEQINLSDFRVFWKSRLDQALPLDSRLVVNSGCRILSTELTRYPVDITAYSGNVMLRGLAGVTTLQAGTKEAAEACAVSMKLTSPTIAARHSEKFVIVPNAQLDGAAWSGRACDLSGEPNRTFGPRRNITLDGYLIGANGGLVSDFTLLLRDKEAGKLYGGGAITGAVRKDVAEYFGSEVLSRSGFKARFSLEGVDAGHYDVVFLFAEKGANFFCESGKNIVVL
ncbi:DUF7657 domain-containing protein [Luteimonas terrae]|uniref:DUF7657 domain-containing protein n=1 Tax=Luteimonas terrae TaxID=1530191 RepID=A0A4R5U6T6_9GAMM|nr:hypothetical protein [Luteimonas terrae]TDK29990.1 hypothetical protein E2F49_12355 [Luteimonas terrae]